MLRRDQPPWRFLELARAYPRIAHLRLGKRHGYLVNDPELVRQILVVSSKLVEKGPGLRAAGLVLGDGLLILPNAEHRPRRRMVNPAFHHTKLAGYADVMRTEAMALDTDWAARPGATVDMSQEMSRLTLGIVGRALFGADLAKEASSVYRDLDRAMSGWEKLMLPGGEALMRLPVPAIRRMHQAGESLDALVRRMIDAVADRRGATADVVGDLLDGEVDGQKLTRDAVRDEAMTLLLAGHETTSNALAWAWHLLSEHPVVAARLRAEVTALGATPTASDLSRLPWVLAVVAETLRLYPPAWVLEREVVQEFELDGWTLPVGSIVLTSQFALHRDERSWRQASQFLPERWLTEQGSFSEDAPGQPRGAWFPFGAGTRQCIGESFAWTEVALVLAVLAPHWAPRTETSWVHKVHAAVTLRPAGGLPMRLERAPQPPVAPRPVDPAVLLDSAGAS